MWILSSIMIIHPRMTLFVFLSTIIFGAVAVTATQNDALLAASESVQLPTYESLHHACHLAATTSGAVIRQRYESVVHGHLTWWDMVPLMALCGIIQGARIWRRRSGTHGEKTKIRDAGSSDHRAISNIRVAGSSPSSMAGKCSQVMQEVGGRSNIDFG